MPDLSPRQRAAVDALARRFHDSFPAETPAWRTVGREAEHPLVHPDGQAADLADLWPALAGPGDLKPKHDAGMLVELSGPRYIYTAEVGRGTVEVITGPNHDLVELEEVHLEAMSRLVAAATDAGVAVLGYGIQPLTPGTRALMTPKPRYGVLLEVLHDPWLWFTLTASDQVQVDVGRDEWVALTNLGNLLAPLTVALCANSPIFEGRPCGSVSARESRMGQICAGTWRHGMPARAHADPADFIATMSAQDHLMRWEGGEKVAAEGLFIDTLDAHGADFEQYLLHEHYIWNSARPRSNHATIELRAACQQPPHEHMASAALGLGVLAAGRDIAALIDDALGDTAWPAMRAWHHRALAEGLAAELPAPGLVEGILDAMDAALTDRGRGEARYLAPLKARLAARENPAQRALAVFEQGGVPGLVEALRWG
ncbi:MAG: hypothetical protein H6739_21585 [Alphaproteobacteria bacterium]|nr:hypothetical protein [Alphaproteobacteria bacterium]